MAKFLRVPTNIKITQFAYLVCVCLALLGLSALANERNDVLESYVKTHDALSTDNLTEATHGGMAMMASADAWLKGHEQSHPEYAAFSDIRGGATSTSKASDLKGARMGFSVASRGIVAFLTQEKTLQPNWQLFFCPMAGDDGFPYANWVQPVGQNLANPWYGSEMLSCGRKLKWPADIE